MIPVTACTKDPGHVLGELSQCIEVNIVMVHIAARRNGVESGYLDLRVAGQVNRAAAAIKLNVFERKGIEPHPCTRPGPF